MNLFTEYTSKVHLFHLIDQTDDKLSFVDKNYIYRAVNKAYVKGFNRSVHEMIGTHVKEIMGDDVFDKIVKPYLDRALNGEEISYEAWFDFPNVKRSYLMVRYKPVYKGDQEISGVAVTVTDITQRKKLEEEKILQDRLLMVQSRMASLGEMVAFMAHQWRRPLHTLSTYLLRIRQESEVQSCLNLDEILDRSEEILEHLSQNLESLYELHTDGDAGMSIKTSIEEVGRFLESQLNAAQISLELDIHDTIVINTSIPNNRLLHLFLVFIENAIEALENSEGEERKITIAAEEKESKVIIDIQDNGRGIALEDKDRIFEAGISTKADEGHGYGLYFAHKILTEQLNGSVELIPDETITWFRLIFPR